MVTGKYPYASVPALQIYQKIENEPLPDAREIYPLVTKRMTDIISKATSKDPKDRYDNCSSFISDLKDLKKELIMAKKELRQPQKGQIRVEVKIENQLESFILINDKGCIGSELTYYGNPGEKIRILVEHKKHHRFLQQFILNKDKKINVKLLKQGWI